MDPAAAVLAFRAALERRSWQEAADLVHPDTALERQRADLNRIAVSIAANVRRRELGIRDDALLFVNSDPHRPNQYLEEYRDWPVTSFPHGPRLGELLDLPPNAYLARSFEAQAVEGERHGEPGRGPLRIEVVRIVERSPDEVLVELRAPDLVSDEDDGLAEISLRRHERTWRLQLNPDEFIAPLP